MATAPAYGAVILTDTLAVDQHIFTEIPQVLARVESALGSAARVTDFQVHASALTPGNHRLEARVVGADEKKTAHVFISVRAEDSASAASIEATVANAELSPAAGPWPGTHAWSERLEQLLAADGKFSELIETYDGTIGLLIGGAGVHIRCYRGKVIEVAPRSIHGADFSVDVPRDVYLDLIERESNDFMAFAMERKFRTSGSGYEYLRMTSALVRIFDIARALHRETTQGKTND